MVNLLKNCSTGKLKAFLASCKLCPRNCKVNRHKNEKGFCKAGILPAVYSYFAHYGEEPPISGKRGSGAIFFTHCNMSCEYCQNYKFSQVSHEKEITVNRLASIMLELQAEGAHNVNLVSPTHYMPQITEALLSAREKGLKIPAVYNTGGYDSLEAIKALDGIIDIYMPDMRYSDNMMAERYSKAPGYVDRNRECVLEMHRQVGGLIIDNDGVAQKGLIIRCLVLPNNIAGAEDTLKFIQKNISPDTYISLMSQYYPAHKARAIKEISKRPTAKEYKKIVEKLQSLGLNNGWIQQPPAIFDEKLAGHNIQPKG